MKNKFRLKRLARLSPCWLLDNKYEIILEYNHGYYLHIKDITTGGEHIYFDGGGYSSKEFGLYGSNLDRFL